MFAVADIVERLVERISAAKPFEDKVSDVVARFLERTADELCRLPGASSGSGIQDEIETKGDSPPAAPSCGP